MILKEFSETDWFAFSGAEEFEDGTLPLIGEGKNFLLIADANGMEIHLSSDNEHEEPSIWFLAAKHTPDFYRLLASAFQESIDEPFIKNIGFYLFS